MPSRVNQRATFSDVDDDQIAELLSGQGIGFGDGEKVALGDSDDFSVRFANGQVIWRDEVNGIDIPILEVGNGNLVATFDVSGGEPVFFGDNDEIALQFDQQNGQFTITDTSNNETRLTIPLAGALQIGARALDMDGQDIVDASTGGAGTIYDASAGHILTAALETVALASDTDMDVAGTDLTDGATVLYDATNGWFPQSVIQQGPGSGLDADTLDGNQKSALDSQYLDAGGDTVTGTLTIDATTGVLQLPNSFN